MVQIIGLLCQKKHWWNKWKKVGNIYNNPEDAYIEYFKLKYNLDIQKRMQFTHNKDKNKKVLCNLEFKFNSHLKDYKYYAGYKPQNYANFYYCCYGKSYEQALNKLYWDLYIKEELLHKKM